MKVRDSGMRYEGLGLPSRSQDGCLLFNILHDEDPPGILTAAAEILRPGGRLFVIGLVLIPEAGQ